MVVSGGAVSPENRSNEEIRANFAAAHEWVSDLCTGKRQWRMRVPVDAGDSDIVLSQAISDGETLLARIAAVEARAADVDLIRRAIADPFQFLPRNGYFESVAAWSARAVVAALAASPTPTGPEPTVAIGGQTMTQEQFDAARFPLLASDPGETK